MGAAPAGDRRAAASIRLRTTFLHAARPGPRHRTSARYASVRNRCATAGVHRDPDRIASSLRSSVGMHEATWSGRRCPSGMTPRNIMQRASAAAHRKKSSAPMNGARQVDVIVGAGQSVATPRANSTKPASLIVTG